MANITTNKQINDTQDLKNLSDRLQQRAFSWQHEDYFLLKRLLPKLIANVDIDFPILKIIDSYLQASGRIEKRHGRICLVDKEGEYLAGGDDLKELLENCIWTFC